MNRQEGLRSVVVVGGGLTALVAALAFARALPRTAVTLVALPRDPAALADRLPAAGPQALALLATLGIEEGTLVAAGAATHRVGTRFAWGAEPFAIGEGDGVPMLAGAALHQLWLARGAGRYDALVPAAALAMAERFAHPVDDPQALLARIDYTLRLDPARAAPLFAQHVRAAGVRIVATDDLAIERIEGGIAAVTAGSERLAADLFVDATGPQARLAAPDAAWVDWSATLPADRLLLGERPARVSPTDAYEAIAIGWTARWPLATRTLAALGYATAVTGEAKARRLFGEGELIALQPRRRATPFAGNVLALGEAAAATGALGWPGFGLALAHLDLALELMPAQPLDPLLVAEYNRRATLMAERVHAYAAAFYLAGPPRKGPFWQALRGRTPPAELAAALVQFGQRGTLPPLEEALVPVAHWRQALIGLGVRPVRDDPVALSLPRASAGAALAQLQAAIAALPARLPPYADYLAAMTRGGR